MKFEDALAAMREGAKIWHPYMPEDEYYMACKIGLVGHDSPIDDLPISIAWMKSGKLHPNMKPRYVFPQDKCSIEPALHSYPMINLLWLMSDEWKILGGII